MPKSTQKRPKTFNKRVKKNKNQHRCEKLAHASRPLRPSFSISVQYTSSCGAQDTFWPAYDKPSDRVRLRDPCPLNTFGEVHSMASIEYVKGMEQKYETEYGDEGCIVQCNLID